MAHDALLPLGEHSIQLDGDLIFMRVRGVVTLEDMKQLLMLQARVRRQHGSVYVLYDSRENTGLEPAARKWATNNATPEMQVDAAASFGAPFGMRVVVNMLNRAHDALRKPGTRTMLFDTEEQARGYLEQERIRLRPSVAA
jgi:hypothetical protein